MRKRILFLLQAFFSFLYVAVVLQASKSEQAEDCSASSCGNILNISHPFRLTDDPTNCGDSQHELSCEDNQPCLYLLGRKYAVLAIEYKTRRIQVIDYDLKMGKCSSRLRSLSNYQLLHYDYYYRYILPKFYAVAYLNCSAPVYDTSFIPVNSCFNASSSAHLYAVLPSMVNASDLPPPCEVVANANVLKPAPARAKNYKYEEVHEMLMMGFELSWECWDCMERNLFCDFSQEPQNVICYSPGDNKFSQILGVILYVIIDCVAYQCRHVAPSVRTQYIITACTYLVLLLMVRAFIGILCFAIFLIYKLRTKTAWMDSTVEDFLSRYRYQTPTRYSYSQIKRMTRGFSDKLGQGGFGSVYKGKLRAGHPVAVKILSAKSKADGQDFINEVATIGRIHHVNVVRLNGFCAEGSKRALIYEFMPNGSLEQYIYPKEGKTCPLSCEKIYEIALGIAHGIEYLHRGCDMKILHFDIKPHNILLDEKFTPKVSDFGLAKFYPTDVSFVSVTAVRGTVGYIAPELVYKNARGVSYKSDVYSFGMLLMEMAGRRKNVNAFANNPSQIYFPLWVYDKLNQGEDIGVEDAGEDEKEVTKKMLIVALRCIQMKPADRPSMTKVVEMLEGSVEQLQLPAKRFLLFPEGAPSEDHETDIDPSKSSSCYEFGTTSSQNDVESCAVDMIVED